MNIESLRNRLVGLLPTWFRRCVRLASNPHLRANLLHERRRRRRGVPVIAGRVRRVVVICHGNICRSPFAEHLLARRAPRLELRSAGLEARDGAHADPGARRLAERFGLDLTRHSARRLREEDVDWSDIVLAMEGWHVVAVERRWPEARGKVHLMGDFLAEGPFGIDDPFGGDDEAFARAFERILEAAEALLSRIDQRDTARSHAR